jgi:VanZ family protein
MRELHYKKLWWRLAWALVAFVFITSLIPMPPPPIDLPGGFDKYEHVLAYATLCGFFGQLLQRFQLHLKISLALIGMGALLEVLQGLTWYRSPDLFDIAANSVGVVSGLVACQTPLGRIIVWLDARIARANQKAVSRH